MPMENNLKYRKKGQFIAENIDQILTRHESRLCPVSALDWGESPRPLIPSLPMSRKFLKLGEVTAIFLPRRDPAQRVLKGIKWYQEWH